MFRMQKHLIGKKLCLHRFVIGIFLLVYAVFKVFRWAGIVSFMKVLLEGAKTVLNYDHYCNLKPMNFTCLVGHYLESHYDVW